MFPVSFGAKIEEMISDRRGFGDTYIIKRGEQGKHFSTYWDATPLGVRKGNIP